MYLEIAGQKWKVSFSHRVFVDATGKAQPQKNPLTARKTARGYTNAIVIGPLFVGEGTAYCSTDDTFNKERGRKTALAKALRRLEKEDRTTIWQAYLERRQRERSTHIQVELDLRPQPEDLSCQCS